MRNETSKDKLLVELSLVAVSIGITVLAFRIEAEKTLVLHLYYLPVVLGGFFLRRYRAGALAFLCALLGALAVMPELNQMTTSVTALAGVLGYLVWAANLGLTAVLVGTLSDQRLQDFSKLQNSHERDVLMDSLTGIANRRSLELELSRRLAEWKRYQIPFALLLVDIDFFKNFNDRYGHQAGDSVLHDVALTIDTTMRESDVVARYGGEEFCALVASASADDAKELGERVRRIIEQSQFQFTRLQLTLTVCVGVAQVMEGDDAMSLIQRADAALYTCKEAGRNCVHFHDGSDCSPYGEGVPVSAQSQYDAKSARDDRRDEFTDDSSGLPNQKVFIDELRRRVAEATRYTDTGDLAILLVEIDAYSKIAERDARAAKKVVATAGRLIRAGLREPDLVARSGENQFAVLLPATLLDGVRVPAQRIVRQISRFSDLEYKWLEFTVSVGAAQFIHGESVASLLERAKAAVDSAVDEGGNRFKGDMLQSVADADAATSEAVENERYEATSPGSADTCGA